MTCGSHNHLHASSGGKDPKEQRTS